ncbi:MFS transporter [Streptomyces sp. NPDC015171]|uniref:MFS transporter n=1 Tax=Streptomyces sp. NPDC015171 TaxID=3364945 RepID=UPI0036FD52E6
MGDFNADASASLLRNQQFNFYWAGQTLSAFGNAFGTLALPLLVLDLTGSLVQMGLVSMIYGVLRLVAGVVVGPVIDRVDRTRLMIWCDLGRLVTYGSVPVVWWVEPQLWLIYVCAAVGAGLGLTFQVAHVSMVQELVPAEQIVDANGRLEASNSFSYLVGPIAAGSLSAVAGPDIAVGIDALTFAGSALSVWLLRSISLQVSDPNADPYATRSDGWLATFRAGVAFLWSNQALRWLTVLLTLFTFVTVSADDLLVYWLRDSLHSKSWVTGLVFAAAALGSLIAAMAAGPLYRRFGFVRCWFGGFFLVAVSVGLLPLTADAMSVAVVGFLFGLGSTLGGICSMSLRQQITPPRITGRVTGAFWTITTSLAPVGAVAMTSACAQWSVKAVLLPVGGVLVLLLFLGSLTPLARPAVPEEAVA